MPRIQSRDLNLAVNDAFDGTLGQWNQLFRDAVFNAEQDEFPNSISAGQVGSTVQADFYIEVRVNFPGNHRIRGRLHYLGPALRDTETPIELVGA